MKEALRPSETSDLTRATRRNIPEYTIIYNNQVRTSQETHYFSATETSQLMPCKIWSFHGGYYEECRFLEYYAVWLL
jgi:hypothetical protein